MYECGTCGYQTKRKWSFDYHNNRKIPCQPLRVQPHVINDEGVKSGNSEGVSDHCKGYIAPVDNSNDNNTVIFALNQCNKCYKVFSRKSGLTQHSKICVGIKTIHCPICLKIFSSPQTKYEHKKNVKCKPPENAPPETFQEGFYRLKTEAKQKDEKIEMKNNEIDELRSELLEKRKPKPKPKRTFVTAITRLEIASSQTWCCSICTHSLPAYFEIDHTIPLWNDGKDILENVTAVCIGCHGEKTHNERKLQEDMKYLNCLE